MEWSRELQRPPGCALPGAPWALLPPVDLAEVPSSTQALRAARLLGLDLGARFIVC